MKVLQNLEEEYEKIQSLLISSFFISSFFRKKQEQEKNLKKKYEKIVREK